MTGQRPFLFLESQSGVASLVTLSLKQAIARAGRTSWVVPVRDETGKMLPVQQVQNRIRQLRPQGIIFLMDAPLGTPELWDVPELRSIPKLSLWFDDYMRSPLTLGGWDVWRHWQQSCGVRVAVWDGYWREQWTARTGCQALPVHLAADPDMFLEAVPPLFPECRDHAVFLGTLPALESLVAERQALPAATARALEEITETLEQSAWPLRPYEAVERWLAEAPAKLRVTVETWMRDPAHAAVFYHQIWRWGKRVARIRGLKAVARSVPLAILSGHRSEKFAGRDEWCRALGCETLFQDTTLVPHARWGGMFRSGRFHVQIFDPQSIQGGIPFRVFECALAGVPLLSDHRAEMDDLFSPETALITASDPEALAVAAAQMIAFPTEQWEIRVAQGRAEAQQRHTWSVRWREWSELLGG